MTATPSEFNQTSRKIVTDFLHSVVVVDDRASLDENENIEIVEEPKKVERVPTTRAKKIEATLEEVSQENDVAKAQLEKSEVNDKTSTRGLKAKILIDSFADKGLVCAVLKPIDHEAGLDIKTDHATHKSDIVILDWQISETESSPGEIALSLIKKIISTDSPGRLRLISIYTTDQNLHGIAQKIKDTISTSEEIALVQNFEVSRGPIKVVLYQKEGGAISIASQRVVSESDLPEKLINDFTELTRGLLSNVALKSLGALRENTHRIINKFNSSLDSSYVSHRVLNTPPAEAESHPVPLIASELLDVLEDCNIKNLVSADFISSWLLSQIAKGLNFDKKFDNLKHNEVLELVLNLIKDGVEKKETYKTEKSAWDGELRKLSNSKKDSKSFLTTLFSLPGTTNIQERDLDFAMLTTIRSKYESPAPLLTLGSIVVADRIADDESIQKHYYLCIQPLCDSVRLEENRNFSFIPLEVSNKPDKFQLVVKDGGEYVKLLTDLKPYNTMMLEFDPMKKGEILASKKGENWVFDCAGKTVELRWIADLKFPHAQRIITQYSEQLGRVGLTESDWLRRMAR